MELPEGSMHCLFFASQEAWGRRKLPCRSSARFYNSSAYCPYGSSKHRRRRVCCCRWTGAHANQVCFAEPSVCTSCKVTVEVFWCGCVCVTLHSFLCQDLHVCVLAEHRQATETDHISMLQTASEPDDVFTQGCFSCLSWSCLICQSSLSLTHH